MIRSPRQVGIKTIFDLLKQHRINLTLGIVFTVLPFMMGTIFLIVFSAIDDGVPKVDYAQIDKEGKTASAIITNVDTQENVTVNNEHPAIISYNYFNGEKELEDRFESLDPDRINRMNVGDTIQIKYLANSSIIVGLESFEFPIKLIFYILIPFLFIGIVTLVILFLRVQGQVTLYKYGIVKEAEVISMTPRTGSRRSSIGQGLIVHYQYKTSRGENILGESFTSDYSILNSTKQGDSIKIFVSSDNESKSCLIPKLDTVRNNWKIED